jgi:hypothetical protein
MYGLVHKSFQEFMESNFKGELPELFVKNHIERKNYRTLSNYEDKELLDTLTALAELTGTELDTILNRFGRHFFHCTAAGKYQDILGFFGGDVLSLITNSDELHARFQSTFFNYQPPSFTITFETEHNYLVTHASARLGLESFVEGLLMGIAQHYKENIEITLIEKSVNPEGQESKFRLVWS